MIPENLAENIRIILVNPSHPGNIGASARALKTMGLSKLYLVDPVSFPHNQATAMAVHADDVLDRVVITKTLLEAVNDCRLVLGTSARLRTLAWPAAEAREAAKQIAEEASLGPIAIVFGRESSGLTNEELACCHLQVQIPACSEYTSLNVAASVQVIAYEIFLAMREVTPSKEYDDLASMAELDAMYDHFEQTLIKIGFLKPENPGRLMGKLRRLFNRARLEKNETQIIRGILTAARDHPIYKAKTTEKSS